MEDFVIKYQIGGFGSLGRVIETHESGESVDAVLRKFWKQYEDLLYCVKPVILGMFRRERFEYSPREWEQHRIPLNVNQARGWLDD